MMQRWAWMLGVLGVVSGAWAQQSVTLQTSPPLAKKLDAFPRVVPSAAVSNAIAATINTNLQRRDETVKKAAKECSDEFFEARGKRDPDGWTRTVTVTMKGPAFLSFEAADFQYCGGAYPQGDTLPMVYDLSTGKPLDWKKVLPGDAVARISTALDGTRMGVVAWAPMRTLALQHSNAECRDALQGEEALRFVLSLDGRTAELVARIADLPHAMAACEGPFRITAAKAKQLGVAARVTDALTASAATYKAH